MIKRLVGLLAAAVILAVIVFTILGAGSYTSFIERHDPPATNGATAAATTGDDTAVAAPLPTVEAADSLATGMPPQESAAE